MTEAMTAADHGRVLNIEQAGAVLGVSRTMVFELIATGQLKSIKVGRRRLIPKESIEAFIAAKLHEDCS